MLASFVLTTGLLSSMALITSSYKVSLDSGDSSIATGLAQEGVELVRNIRDNNIAAGHGAFDGFPDASTPHCRMSYDSSVLTCSGSFNNPGPYYLAYDSSRGTYRHSGASGRFSRYIHIDRNGSDSVTIRSFVYRDPSLYMPPANGDVGGCNAAHKCTYTEVTLTNWK